MMALVCLLTKPMKTSKHLLQFTFCLTVCLLMSMNALAQSKRPEANASGTSLQSTNPNDLKPATGRACKPATRSNPYSISKKNFDQLPADRQRFVLDNSHKYTITD